MADLILNTPVPRSWSAGDAESIKQAVLAASTAQAIDSKGLSLALIQSFALIDAASSGTPQ